METDQCAETSTINIQIIDNLERESKELTDLEAMRITEFVRKNIIESNEGEYAPEEIDYLIKIKTPETIKERSKNGFLVYLTNELDEIIGCGMIIKKDGKYNAKILNVRKDYRGNGLGRTICEIRERKLREMGIKEVYNESLKFRNTLRFHRSRDFFETGEDGKGLFLPMKKEL